MKRLELSNKKQVLAADPYEPDAAMRSTFVGRENELRMITAAWMTSGPLPPLSPLLVGEPGVGKNRLVYELSRMTGLPLYIMQGHEDVTAEDLACAVRFGDSGHGAMDYILSPLVSAMRDGGICFIDEIGKMRPRALALLISVLDERRYIDSNLLGERVHARSEFRFIAATNTGEINAMPEFIRSRLRPLIEVGHPPREEIEAIVMGTGTDPAEREVLLETFWSLWAESTRRPTPRDAIHHFALASRLGAFADRAKALPEGFHAGADTQSLLRFNRAEETVSPVHLREAYDRLFAEESA